MFNGNLPLSPRDQVMLNVADIDPDFPILEDNIYEHLLTKYEGNVTRASLDAARTILFYLSRFTRERAGQIERYGAEWATNYRKALELYLKDPNLSVIKAVPYAGGISKSDMQANNANEDNVQAWRGGCKPEDDSESLFI